jgi:uncharacterized protein involved in exopolysaccharide biosynthesis
MTPNPAPRPTPETAPSTDSADLFDYELIRDYLGFAFRSFRRHQLLAVLSFLGVLLASAGALVALPKTYHTETKILAERNQVMPALGNPSRSIPQDADAPTRAASEIILRRDNLVALIKQTDLLDQWDATRAPASRARDAVLRVVQGTPDDEQRIDALAGLLEKRLKVETGEGTVTIGIDWPNAQMAFRLVEAAQQNFLEARHAMEVSTIAEAISILEGHAANVRESIYGELEELKRLREGHQKNLPASVVVRTPAQTGRSQVEQDLAQVRVMLVAKRRAIADLEDFRARRLSDLQAQLAEQKTTYAAAHPIVVNTEQQISALNRESPQIAALRREEQELLRDYERQGGKADDLMGTAAPLPRLPEGVREVKHAAPDPQDDEATDYEKTRLRIAVNKYEELLGRIEAARIELDTARAAFKYRYSIVRPAQVPKHADKPNVAVTLLGGVMGGLLLALCLCLLKDLAGARFVERWQIERWLEIPVLSEVDRP